ncbi:unnamed protein product, partial [Allacma fusca]
VLKCVNIQVIIFLFAVFIDSLVVGSSSKSKWSYCDKEPTFCCCPNANVDSVLEKEQTRNIVQSTVSARRFTSSLETIIIPVQNAQFPPNFEHKGYFPNGNKNVFIFVGPEETVNGILTWRSVKKLRWKFGIVHRDRGKNLVTSGRELIFLNSDLLPSFGADKLSLSRLHFYTTALRVDAYVAWDTNKAPFMGAFFNAVQAFSKLSNFTFSVNLPPGGMNKLSNGSWTGAVGDVLYNNKDMLLGFGQSYHRDYLLDYSTLFGFIEVTFYKAHPKVGTTDGSLLKIYQPFVWVLIGVTFALLVVVVYFETRQTSIELLFSFWMLYRSHLEQPVSLRNSRSNTPSTFEDLALRKDYQPYFMTVKGAGVHYLKTSNASSVVAIRKRMIVTADKKSFSF